jgi:uncharacterized protein (DUF488 family)
MSLPFFTVGHSTRSITEFARLLQLAGVELVADIRRIPMSRSNPSYNKDVLPQHLAGFQIGYSHVAELGGRQPKSKAIAPEVNGLWENQSFHNYADYALSERFHAGLEGLILRGRARRCAMMCAEAVWWRCHRRIVADYLIARGEEVFHLMGQDRIEAARLTKGAKVTAGSVLYPAGGGDSGTGA